MAQPHQSDFCLCMSADELKMILSALSAYSHNSDYVELVKRLHHQIGASDPSGCSESHGPTRSLAG